MGFNKCTEPVHASETLRLYGYGIGCNAMEAREQKHQQIAKYSHNTTRSKSLAFNFQA